MAVDRLENELKDLIVRALKLRDVRPADIDSEAPLFNEGLGLDSLDALQLAIAIQESYGVKLAAHDTHAREVLRNVRSLAAYITSVGRGRAAGDRRPEPARAPRTPTSLVALGRPGSSGGTGDESDRTWDDLARDVEIVRVALERGGWHRPIVCCDDRYRAAVALLAAWSGGRAAVLSPSSRPETLREVAAHAGADVVLHDGEGDGPDVRALLAAGLATPVTAAEEARERLRSLLELRGSRELVTLYTSGSTGAPTPWPKTAEQLFGEADALVRAFSLDAGTRVLSTAPAHHIYGLLFSVVAPLVAGGAFARETPLHAQTIAALLAQLDANVLCTVPPHLHSLRTLGRGELAQVRRVFCSGGPLATSDAAALRARFGLVVTEVLGSTETGGIAWRIAGDGLAWTPLPGVSVGADADGVVLLSSPFIPAEAPRPMRGSDRVELVPGGFLHLGRADGVVKVGGKRVSLPELEQRLLAIAGVQDAAVIALPCEGPRETEICAAVVAPQLDAPAIRQALAQWLDPVSLPRRFAIVDALPRESTGKLPRESLRALFPDAQEGSVP